LVSLISYGLSQNDHINRFLLYLIRFNKQILTTLTFLLNPCPSLSPLYNCKLTIKNESISRKIIQKGWKENLFDSWIAIQNMYIWHYGSVHYFCRSRKRDSVEILFSVVVMGWTMGCTIFSNLICVLSVTVTSKRPRLRTG
jgi:hypothetical protein